MTKHRISTKHDQFWADKVCDMEERLNRAEEMRTQGKKGCKAQRINMAFSPTNHTYISIMSRVMGLTMTDFVNYVIAQHRLDHSETYEKAISVLEKI